MESRNPAFRGHSFQKRADDAAYGTSGQYGAPGTEQGYGGQGYGPREYGPAYDVQTAPAAPPVTRPMTLDDVVVRAFMTLATLVATAALAWTLVPAELSMPVLAVSVVAMLGVWAFITFGRKANAPLVLTFAAIYGVMVGVVSHAFNDLYHGVVFQAVIGTALAFAAMLAVHALRIVRVTPKFVRFTIAVGGALMGLMIIDFVVFAFGGDAGIGIRDAGSPLAYVFSIVAILIGCFFLLLDFDSIEASVREGAPEKFAWYCAFGLVLSLVWIYLELLRLLSYFYAGRD